MKTEIQNQAWAALPEDFRREVREKYNKLKNTDDYESETSQITIESIFGKHNLTVVEQPQPRFKVGDNVMIDGVINFALNYHVGSIIELPNIDHPCTYKVSVLGGYAFLEEVYLNPYTSPGPKGKESGAKGNDSENSLNLCKMLKDHVGEYFYSPYLGNCKLDEIKPDEDHNQIWLRTDNGVWVVALPSCGHEPDGAVMLFPSRALYEQYPLDAARAWSEWQKEQKKPFICIHWGEIDCNGDEEEDYIGNIYFRTPSDHSKCIEEIKSVIEKYSK